MWTCYCGHENDGAFCASCGAPAPVTPAAGFPTRRQICETARKRLHDQHYASNCTYLTLIGTQTLSTGVVVGITYFVVLMSVFFTAQPLVLTFRGHSFDPSQYLLPFLTPSFRRRQQAARKMLTEDARLFTGLFEANAHSHEAVRQYRQMLNLAAAGDIDLLCQRAAWWWPEDGRPEDAMQDGGQNNGQNGQTEP